MIEIVGRLGPKRGNASRWNRLRRRLSRFFWAYWFIAGIALFVLPMIYFSRTTGWYDRMYLVVVPHEPEIEAGFMWIPSSTYGLQGYHQGPPDDGKTRPDVPRSFELDSGCFLLRCVRSESWGFNGLVTNVSYRLLIMTGDASPQQAARSQAYQEARRLARSELGEDISRPFTVIRSTFESNLRETVLSSRSAIGDQLAYLVGRWHVNYLNGFHIRKNDRSNQEHARQGVIALVLGAFINFAIMPIQLIILLQGGHLPARLLRRESLLLLPCTLQFMLAVRVFPRMLEWVRFEGMQGIQTWEIVLASAFFASWVLLWGALTRVPRLLGRRPVRRVIYASSALVLGFGQWWLFHLESPLAPAALWASGTGIAICVLFTLFPSGLRKKVTQLPIA